MKSFNLKFNVLPFHFNCPFSIPLFSGKYELRDDWFAGVSAEARDFISKLMVYQPQGRMDVRTALQHPWLNFADKMPAGERQIPTDRLKQYYSELK